MTKSEWVDTIAEKTGLSKKEAAAALDALTSTITDGLKDEGKLAVCPHGPQAADRGDGGNQRKTDP